MKLAIVLALAALTVGLAGCAQDKDSDGDGLYDSVERQGWTVRVDTMTQHLQYRVSSDPTRNDTDGDGVNDWQELQVPPFTDPTKRDTDGDGLTDCQEKFHTVVAECEDPSYKGAFDGGYPTHPAHADSDPGYSYLVNDIWLFSDENGDRYRVEHGDGISDYDEIMGYEIFYAGQTRTITTGPMDSDWDQDGLSDGEELYFGSHPKIEDTDGDKCIDGFDDDPARKTKFNLGLEGFRLKRSFDPIPGADLRMFALFHGQPQWFPEGSSIRLEPGDNDISEISPEGLFIDCSANDTPFDPWNPQLSLQFLAIDIDGSDSEEIFLEENVRSYYWNLRTGKIMMDGTDIMDAGTATINGPDAVLTFSPVQLPQ